ncbi:MAG: galactokinase [Nocardioides sp.]
MSVTAWAPGRVNLIGEHTDYNGGLCLPITIGHGTTVVARPRDDAMVRLTSHADAQTWEGLPAYAGPGRVTGWAAYAAGTLWALDQAGIALPGLDLEVTSDLPLGAGLSSSASLEAAVALVAWAAAGRVLDAHARDLLVAACIRAETDVVGAPTGGLDQRAVLESAPGHALLLDFGTDESTSVPLDLADHGLSLLVVDTRVSHSHADGEYGSRRAECELAAQALGVGQLSDASAADVADLADPMLRGRARHVLTENDRVRRAVAAVRAGNWTGLGVVLTESHGSMRDDFEISCPELDLVVSTALEAGALGARMTGGGFGGSALALAPIGDVDTVRRAVDRAFARHGYRSPGHLDAAPAGPARLLTS